MRAVLDTNLLLSALIGTGSPPARIYRAWEDGAFDLVTSSWQLDELRRASRYPKLQKYVKSYEADAMASGLRLHALVMDELPEVEASPDPDDNPLLATALAGNTEYLVTGDKELLALEKLERTRILDARTFLDDVLRLPPGG